MTITEITDAITAMTKKLRPPVPQIPRLLLVCSMKERPGLSAIFSTANVVTALQKLGIPTGPMPDGTDNKTVGVVYSIFNEFVRALRFDASIQCGEEPGSSSIVSVGVGATGPVNSQGTNTKSSIGYGAII